MSPSVVLNPLWLLLLSRVGWSLLEAVIPPSIKGCLHEASKVSRTTQTLRRTTQILRLMTQILLDGKNLRASIFVVRQILCRPTQTLCRPAEFCSKCFV
jgi:hypothetical protein